MKVVETRKLFDVPDVGTRDINGTFVKQLDVTYARHRLRLMLNFVPIGKIIPNQEQNRSILPTASRTNQQPELLVAVKNLTLRMTSWLRHVRHSSKHESFWMQLLRRPRNINPDRRPVLVTIGLQDWILVLKQYCYAVQQKLIAVARWNLWRKHW